MCVCVALKFAGTAHASDTHQVCGIIIAEEMDKVKKKSKKNKKSRLKWFS